jgi:ATP-dependent Clp protease ATP-binding subunit ClpX
VREELQFVLRDWLKHEDLFEYGITPQFLSRFDAVVLLENLDEEALFKIFTEGSESGLRQTGAYFQSLGVKLELTAAAARRIAKEAARQPRLGARALKEIFRRVVSPYEFDPRPSTNADGVLRIDVPEVQKALARLGGGGSATSSAGWESSRGPTS